MPAVAVNRSGQDTLTFLPHKSGQRRKQLEALQAFAGTLVLYESPCRIEKLLTKLEAVFPERQVVLARELAKKFEEFLNGKPAELIELLKKRSLKGLRGAGWRGCSRSGCGVTGRCWLTDY